MEWLALSPEEWVAVSLSLKVSIWATIVSLPVGIVYETDANAEKAVRIVATFPEDSHAPIIYPAAVATEATSPDAAAFMQFLRTETAAALFERQGFKVLAPAPAH